MTLELVMMIHLGVHRSKRTSAPSFKSSLTSLASLDFKSPTIAAVKADPPEESLAFVSAPLARRTLTISAFMPRQAMIKGVVLKTLDEGFTATPLSSSIFTIAKCP